MSRKSLIVIVASVIGFLFLSGAVVYFGGDNWPERGTIGDSFGMANALFSGFAFVGIVYAIFLQREELGLQRDELRMTREELSKSAESQKRSADTQRQLAQLNAYSSLLNCKLEKMRSSLENASKSNPKVAESWLKSYKQREVECSRIEAYIENILFRVGGRLDDYDDSSQEEIQARLKAMNERFSKGADVDDVP
jgi:septal ring factor EnvC (AmiA/AmiB activator)